MGGVRQIELPHGCGSTRIWIGSGALESARPELTSWIEGRRVFVVTSAPVRALHGDRLAATLECAAADTVEVVWLEVADGEAGKDLATVERLAREMVVAGGKRDSRLLTFGGGAVCDVGGFVASCFLRGIECSHVPTTLLAQVDAAIGGKTGVNLPEAKNSVGAFHQPRFVIADTAVLKTLSPDQLRQGLFEVVKAAVLSDEGLFRMIEDTASELINGDAELLAEATAAAVAVKVEVVAGDERESDRRRLLNLGHTLGHALETALGHGRIGHGDAVGHGMLFAVELAKSRGLCAADAASICELIKRMAPHPLPHLDPAPVLRAMVRDKKGRETGLSWVLPVRIGAAEVVDGLDQEVVERLLASFLTGSVQSG